MNENDPILIEFPYGFLEFDFTDDKVRLVSKILKNVKNVLDLSSGELKFASEYNGPQHYYFPNQYNKIYNNDFDKTFASFLHFLRGSCNDLSRKEFTNRNNTVLTEFPYWVD